jgi:hypothetical protein
MIFNGVNEMNRTVIQGRKLEKEKVLFFGASTRCQMH